MQIETPESETTKNFIRAVQLLKQIRDTLYAHNMDGNCLDPFIFDDMDNVIVEIEKDVPGIMEMDWDG